jgi:hypothetical protein
MNENCMDYVHLTDDQILGNHKWKGKLDLLNVVLIGITKEVPKRNERYELHRLLAVLFSDELSVDEKLNIMETEYHIPLEDNTRKGLQRPVDVGFKPTGTEVESERYVQSERRSF